MKLYNVIVVSHVMQRFYIQFLPYFYRPQKYLVLSDKSTNALQYLWTHGDIVKINETTPSNNA